MSMLAFLFSFVTCRKRTTNTSSYETKTPASTSAPAPTVTTYSPVCTSLKSYSAEVKPLLVSFLVKTMYFSASPLGSTNVNCLIRLSKFSYT